MWRASCGFVAAALLAGAACTDKAQNGGSRPDEGPTGASPPTSASVPEAVTGFTITATNVHAPGSAELPADTIASVREVLNAYLDRAVVGPIESGQPSDALAALFTPNAADRLEGPDGDVLVEQPRLGGSEVRVSRADASLSGLAGTDGRVEVAVAEVSLDVEAATRTGSIVIGRRGEIVLVADGGTWKIDSYELTVDREESSSAPGGTRS